MIFCALENKNGLFVIFCAPNPNSQIKLYRVSSLRDKCGDTPEERVLERS